MKKIEGYIRELNHLDKRYNRNSRAQKERSRKRLFQRGDLINSHTSNQPIKSKEDFDKFSGITIMILICRFIINMV